MRPFGRAADLDVDFARAGRPDLVTTLLTHCSEEGDAAFWWAQPVGDRTSALLRLLAVTERCDTIALTARCTADGCGDIFEFSLPLRELASESPPAARLHLELGADRHLTMRRPTGDDLRAWRSAPPPSRDDALRMMLDSLILEGHATPDDAAAVSASIAALDPLVDFSVSCDCAACGAPNDVLIDLETLALGKLARRQQSLLREVHGIASAYGWSEAEVLEVPPWRRTQYLTLIEDER